MLIEALGLADARVVSLTGAGGKTSLMFALGREFAKAGERVLLTTTTKISKRESELLGPPIVTDDLASIPDELLPAPGSAVIACSGPNERGDRVLGFAPEVIDEAAQGNNFDRIIVEADGSARRPLKAPAAHEPVAPGSTDVMISVAGLGGLGERLDEEHLFRSDLWSRITQTGPGDAITAQALARALTNDQGFSKGLPDGAAWAVFLNQADDEVLQSAARQVSALVKAQTARRPRRMVSGALLPDPRIDFIEVL